MSETNWNDLARRCEEATGADREIDGLIAKAVGDLPDDARWNEKSAWGERTAVWATGHFGAYKFHHPDEYTASLDAITALIERELPGHAWSIVHRLTTSSIRPNGQIWTREERSTKHGDAATPALALCAAFCKAMAHRSTPHE